MSGSGYSSDSRRNSNVMLSASLYVGITKHTRIPNRPGSQTSSAA